ncbi:MAG: lysophospholipid acyltransferase family protein, partial [Gammaproteobacteria bacterium]
MRGDPITRPRPSSKLASALRVSWRAPLALLLLLCGLAIVFLAFPRLDHARRARTVARWSRVLLKVCGVRLIERPAPGAAALEDPAGPALLLLNHVNWLDVFLVLSRTPAHFVAKIEIARWPVVGALVAGAGTLFIERGRRRAVHQLNDRIAELLRAGHRVAVFPEGTTGDGRRLLPFHANLVEPAMQAGVPVVPVGV